MKLFHALILALFMVVSGTRAQAHHSGSEYDLDKIVEIEGTLVEIRWQNPHVQLRVRAPAPAANGKMMLWEIEGSSLSVLRRTNVDPRKLHVGDKVKVAGEQSKRAPNRMFAHNLLCADGTELVFHPGGRAQWKTTKTAMGTTGTWFDPGTPDASGAGLFRVWSWKLDDPDQLWQESYPLTPAAAKKFAAWDPVHDEITPGCEPKGMPTIMETPYPVEFVRAGDDIRLRIEEFDTVRTIHMSANVQRDRLPKSRLGRSTGRWDGRTLVVTTDGISWPYLDPAGTPLSPSASLVERFTPSADGARLEYSLVVTDPVTFTKPLELKRAWVARPNESVKAYRCGQVR